MSVDKTAEGWSVPPELEHPVPRRLRLDGLGVVHCLIAMGCLAAAGFGIHRIVGDELRRQAENETLTRELATAGRETDATITDLRIAMGKHWVGFDYTIDGRDYMRGAPITPEHWQALEVGSPLAIRYLPSDPSQSSPVADPPDSQNNWSETLPLAGMLLFFMLSFAAIHLSILFPKRSLLKRGRPARGIVTLCKEGSKAGTRGFLIDYDFSLPDGSLCHGKAFRRYEEEEGSAVTVLYDIHRPQRSILYPLSQTVWEVAGTPEVLSILQ